MLLQIIKTIVGHKKDRDAIELQRVHGEIRKMADELANLTAQVAATNTVLGELAAKVSAGGIDPAAVAAATASLKQGTDAAAAVLQSATPAPAPSEPAPAPAAPSEPAAGQTA